MIYSDKTPAILDRTSSDKYFVKSIDGKTSFGIIFVERGRYAHTGTPEPHQDGGASGQVFDI
jgi:hypothetical protein